MSKINFDNYVCFDPGVDRPLSQVSKSKALAHFDLLMREKQERISQLKTLVAQSNIILNDSDESIQRLNDWFYDNIEKSETEPNNLKPIWYSVVNDIALFLGEQIIKRAPNLKWDLYLSGKTNVSYQRPVIIGFTKVKNPKYNIDIDWAIAAYGHRIILNSEKERDLFVRIVNTATIDA